MLRTYLHDGVCLDCIYHCYGAAVVPRHTGGCTAKQIQTIEGPLTPNALNACRNGHPCHTRCTSSPWAVGARLQQVECPSAAALSSCVRALIHRPPHRPNKLDHSDKYVFHLHSSYLSLAGEQTVKSKLWEACRQSGATVGQAQTTNTWGTSCNARCWTDRQRQRRVCVFPETDTLLMQRAERGLHR